MKHLIISFAVVLCTLMHINAQTCNVDSIRRLIDAGARTPIEGIWKWTDGATIAIVRTEPTRYKVIFVDSPDLRIAPGTTAGYASISATTGTYDMTLYSKVSPKGKLSSEKHFTAKVQNSDLLSLAPYKQGYKVDWWRLMPHFFRAMRIQSVDTRPAGLDGGQRVYPEPQFNQFEPVAL